MMFFLDLDGVLNDWIMYELSRRAGRPLQESDYPTQHGWHIRGALEHLTGERLTFDEFWDTVPEWSWVDCPKSDIFDLVIDGAATLVGRDNVRIVTATPRNPRPSVFSGKAKWVERNVPDWLRDGLYIGNKKADFAGPGRILIDDADHNYAAWEAAGGECCLVPRPWNRLAGQDTECHVRTFFDTLLSPWFSFSA